MVGGLGWHYREKIADKFGLLAQRPSDESLLAFNNEKFEVLNDSLIIDSRNSTVSILFLGNSLTCCGVADEDPDKTKRGLASTSIEKDYVHRLVQMISERDSVNVRYSVTNIAEFERQFYLCQFSWAEKLTDAKVQQPDILVVQIGENVSTDAITNHREEFIREYASLLERYPHHPSVLDGRAEMRCYHRGSSPHLLTSCGPFSSCTQNSDPRNFAKYYRQYSNPGVGEHPSDSGFVSIAMVIYTELNF